ncbi:hypothetical protein [Pedobacter hiemivivus]|nr:hypothetical protein [Pedobacter hiemivivus]
MVSESITRKAFIRSSSIAIAGVMAGSQDLSAKLVSAQDSFDNL